MKRATKAVVIGVGAEEGLGAALCRRFAAEGHHVLVAGPTTAKIEKVAAAVVSRGGRATAVQTDATREADVVRLFDLAMEDGETGAADLIAYNAGPNNPYDFRTMTTEWFEDAWRVCCFGGFLVGREAARRLTPLGRGTVIFTGATGSLRGKPPFTAFAAGKAGLRAVAQSMAREFGPLGVHVAHVIVDGGIDGDRWNERFPEGKQQRGADGLLDHGAIADAFWFLHMQPRSAWSFEMDLRPFKEPF